jgi:predicted secreted Zn-dependent protease
MLKSILIILVLVLVSSAKADFIHTESQPQVSHRVYGSFANVDKQMRNINKNKNQGQILFQPIGWCDQHAYTMNDDVYLHTGIHVPVWADYHKAPKREQRAWDAFYANVYKHELTHKHISIRILSRATVFNFSQAMKLVHQENRQLDIELGLSNKYYPIDFLEK